MILSSFQLKRDFEKLQPQVICLEGDKLNELADDIFLSMKELARTKPALQKKISEIDAVIGDTTDPEGTFVVLIRHALINCMSTL